MSKKVKAVIVSVEANDEKAVKVIYKPEGKQVTRRSVVTKYSLCKAISESSDVVKILNTGIKNAVLEATLKEGKITSPKLSK